MASFLRFDGIDGKAESGYQFTYPTTGIVDVDVKTEFDDSIAGVETSYTIFSTRVDFRESRQLVIVRSWRNAFSVKVSGQEVRTATNAYIYNRPVVFRVRLDFDNLRTKLFIYEADGTTLIFDRDWVATPAMASLAAGPSQASFPIQPEASETSEYDFYYAKADGLYNYSVADSNPLANVIVDTVNGLNATLTGGYLWDGSAVLPNSPPTADAGIKIFAIEGQEFQLSGSGSDNDGTVVSQVWAQTQGTTTPLSDSTVLNPTGTRAVTGTPETLIYQLIVTDDEGAESPASTVEVHVIEAEQNVAPVADAGPNQLGIEANTTVTLDGSGSSDLNGSIVEWRWTQITDGSSTAVTITNDVSTATATFVAPSLFETETLVFQLIVVDDEGVLSPPVEVSAEVVLDTSNLPVDLSEVTSNLGEFSSGSKVTLDLNSVVADSTLEYIRVILLAPLYASSYNTRDITNGVFTATAPTVYSDVTMNWRVEAQDKASGVVVTKPVSAVIKQVVNTVTANAGDDINDVEVGDTVTLDGGGSVIAPLPYAKYIWHQTKGPLVELSNKNAMSPTFTVPDGSEADMFADDLDMIPAPSVANFKPAVGIAKHLDVDWLGAMRFEEDNADYAEGALGFNPDRNSLYICGHSQRSLIGEVAIPQTLSMSDVVANIPAVTMLQPFTLHFRVRVGTEDVKRFEFGNLSTKVNGIQYLDGKLVVSTEIDYDNTGNRDNLMVMDADDLTLPPKGMMQLEHNTLIAGYISEIPPDSQALLGAEHLIGWSSAYSINARYSQGPSLGTFDPQDAIDKVMTETDRGISADMHLAYPMGGNVLSFGSNEWQKREVIHPIQTELSAARYGFIIPNSGLFLALGSSAGNWSGLGYKIQRNDFSSNTTDGGAPYDPNDAYAYYWLYKLSDIKANAAVDDARPIAYGKMNLPYGGNITGGAFDKATDTLYVCIDKAGRVGQFSQHPLVGAMRVKVRDSNSTPLSLPTDLEFRLEVTSLEGVVDTARVQVTTVPAVPKPKLFVTPASRTVQVNGTLTPWSIVATDINGAIVANPTIVTTGSVDITTAGSYVETFNWTHEGVASNEATRTTTVTPVIVDPPANTAPTVTLSNQTVTVGDTVTMTAVGTDSESADSSLTYTFTKVTGPAIVMTGSGDTRTFIASTEGTLEIGVIASDGELSSVQAVATIIVEAGTGTPPTTTNTLNVRMAGIADGPKTLAVVDVATMPTIDVTFLDGNAVITTELPIGTKLVTLETASMPTAGGASYGEVE